jgi:hypothetical protein
MFDDLLAAVTFPPSVRPFLQNRLGPVCDDDLHFRVNLRRSLCRQPLSIGGSGLF